MKVNSDCIMPRLWMVRRSTCKDQAGLGRSFDSLGRSSYSCDRSETTDPRVTAMNCAIAGPDSSRSATGTTSGARTARHSTSRRKPATASRWSAATPRTTARSATKQLTQAAIDGHEVCYCTVCRGFLATNATFAQIVQLKRAKNGPGTPVPLPFDRDELNRRVKCPCCRKPMDTHPYHAGGNAVIDTCHRCRRRLARRGRTDRARPATRAAAGPFPLPPAREPAPAREPEPEPQSSRSVRVSDPHFVIGSSSSLHELDRDRRWE